MMRFTDSSASFKRFFALIPHQCWVCGATYWLERGYRRGRSPYSPFDYRCHLCYPIVQSPEPGV